MEGSHEWADSSGKKLLRWQVVFIILHWRHLSVKSFWNEWMPQECWVGCISSCPLCSPLVSCSYFMEGSWQPIICSIGRSTLWDMSVKWEEKEVNQIPGWEYAPTAWVSDLENVTGIGFETLCVSCQRKIVLDWSFWIQYIFSSHPGRMVDRCNSPGWSQIEAYGLVGCDEREGINSHFHSLQFVQCYFVSRKA